MDANSNFIAIASEDQIHLYSESGEYLYNFFGHTAPVTCLQFARDEPGNRDVLVSGSEDGVVRLWDCTTGTHEDAHMLYSMVHTYDCNQGIVYGSTLSTTVKPRYSVSCTTVFTLGITLELSWCGVSKRITTSTISSDTILLLHVSHLATASACSSLALMTRLCLCGTPSLGRIRGHWLDITEASPLSTSMNLCLSAHQRTTVCECGRSRQATCSTHCSSALASHHSGYSAVVCCTVVVVGNG